MTRTTSLVVREAAKHADAVPAGVIARRAVRLGLRASRDAAQRLIDESGRALDRTRPTRLPIQRAVDVAVPVRVAWKEWMRLELLPEGVHRVCSIRRDGDDLAGRIASPRKRRWRAVVLDDRPRQSFAWQSVEGADCAGLITFHALSRRLTRLELSLDVVPVTATQSLAVASHLADREANRDLRRFKARLEVINPDLYDD